MSHNALKYDFVTWNRKSLLGDYSKNPKIPRQSNFLKKLLLYREKVICERDF